MKSVQNTYFNINISNNKGFASLYDEEKYLFTKIKFRVYWINKIKNICDVVHFVYPTLPQFPAKCGSGVPFFIYFAVVVDEEWLDAKFHVRFFSNKKHMIYF